MPDNDIVPRGVRRHWRPAARLFIGGHEPAIVGVAIERALAQTVRESALPPAAPFVRMVQHSIDVYSTSGFEDARRDYLRRAGGGQLALDVVGVVQAMHETERQELLSWPAADVGREVMARALRRCAIRCLVGPDVVMDRMIRGGHSLSDIARHEQACVDLVRYDAIAYQVERGNSAHARSPARPWSRQDLAGFLRRELD